MTENEQDARRTSREYVIMRDEPCPICGNPKWRLTPDADSVAICPDCDYATDDPLDYHDW